jgi:hypothetical protein
MLSFTIWALVAVQTLGIASTWLARRAEGGSWQTTCQWLFLFAMALAGSGAVFSVAIGPGACVMSGASLAGMAVGAVWDFGRSGSAAL